MNGRVQRAAQPEPASRTAILSSVSFRDRLIATLRAVEPILEVPGVLVAGSEVPNLLEVGAASTLVVSQDVDLAIPVSAHADVRARLDRITELAPSRDEPSVWVPVPGRADLIEVNFIGVDPAILDPIDTYERPDDRLPLMVFGPLSLLRPALRHQVRTNLSILSLIEARPSMPDPSGHRATIAELLGRLEAP